MGRGRLGWVDDLSVDDIASALVPSATEAERVTFDKLMDPDGDGRVSLNQWLLYLREKKKQKGKQKQYLEPSIPSS